VESGLKLAQRLHGSIAARPLIHLEHDFRLADLRFRVRRRKGNRHRHNLLLELPRGLRGLRLGVAGESELVRLLARDAVVPRHALRGQPHRQIRIRIVLLQPGIDGNLVAAERDEGHGFRPAGHDHLRSPTPYALHRQGDSLQPAGAIAVDGHGGRFNRHARAQGGHPRHVHTLFALRHGAADNHILDFFLIQARYAPQRALDGHRRQVIGPGGPQHSFGSLAHGRPHGAHNHCVSHGCFSLLHKAKHVWPPMNADERR
jgi:hypothetical protein